MKQFTFLLTGIMALFFCVAASKAPVKSLLQDGKGNWLIVDNQVIQATQQLSKDDIARITTAVKGMGEFGHKLCGDIIDEKVIMNKSALSGTPAGRDIMTILTKYKPQKMADGILVINNAVVQASKPLSRSDYQRLVGISRENKQAATLVTTRTQGQYVDETVYTTDSREKSPRLREQFSRVMNRYVR